MKTFATIAGRSLPFNIGFTVLNLIGLAFLVIASLNYFPSLSFTFYFVGIGLMVFAIAGIVIFKGRLLMSGIARVLVGGLFIVSGLVKANDPIGFSYKLEEYFQDGALAYRIKELVGDPGFSLEFLMSSALSISVLICIAEIVLGVLTIIGGKMKLVSYLLMTMMLFFTFLTWHTADCSPDTKFLDRDTYSMSNPVALQKIAEAKLEAKSKSKQKKVVIHSQTSTELVIDEMKSPQCVTDCGCFGDALKGSVGRSLTPKESLWKDLILLYLVIWIFVAQWTTKPNTTKENLVYSVTSLIVVSFFSFVFGWYFPMLFALIAILGALWIKRVGGRIVGNYLGSALFVTLMSVLVVLFVLRYAPIKDYRPYAVGSDLNLKMKDGVQGAYESLLVYRNIKTGKKRSFLDSSNEYADSKIWEDPNWEFDSMDDREIRPTIPASIADFAPMILFENLSDNERKLAFVREMLTETKVKRIRLLALDDETTEDVLVSEFDLEDYPAEQYEVLDTIEVIESNGNDIEIKLPLFAQKRAVVLVSRNLNEANWTELDRLKQIAKECESRKIPFLMITNASQEDINAFRKMNNFNCAIFTMDEIELKIISRSNPALLVLEKGVVKEKYSHRMIPTGTKFKEIHLK